MRMVAVRVALATVSLSACAAHASDQPDPQPKRGPVPAWVMPIAIPAPDPSQADAPMQVLVLGGQSRIDAKGTDTYFEMVLKPQNLAGLQGMSNIVLPWNTARSGLTIHAIEAIRDGKRTDLIGKTPFTILRRESNLEASRLDGVRSVVLQARGVELGDSIRISATYSAPRDALTPQADETSGWNTPFFVTLLDRRYLVAPDVSVQWRTGVLAPKPTITQTPGGTLYSFTAKGAEETKFPKFMRPADKDDSIQFTSFRSWSEVAAAHSSLYDQARKTADGSPLAAEASKIAASSSDPHKRMLAALQLAQERVRYIAMLLGDGAFKPTGADETWENRYGDCKAKTALLLALLDRLGIEAAPMYVSADEDNNIDQLLPSMSVFNHVIVKAKIAGKTYYLDATDLGHRTTADVAAAVFGRGLPLARGATLEVIPDYVANEPAITTELTWDGSRGLEGEVPVKAVLTLRGPNAILARVKKSAATKTSEFETFLKNYIPKVDNDDLTITRQFDDPVTGNYIVELSGKADMRWDDYEDRKGIRFPFSNTAISWDADFDRKEGRFKDSKVQLNRAYWQQEIETVILPTAKGFKIDDAAPIDRTLAGTHIWRTVTQDGNRVTATSNFRHIADEITAEEARAAESEAEKLSDNWAYLIGPRGLRRTTKSN